MTTTLFTRDSKMIMGGNARGPARPPITTVMTFVTPVMAREWLDKNNVNNRSIRKGDVEALRLMISRGMWEPTHQGIAFYDDHTFADGQHRLHAIAAAGIGVWVNVTTGLPRRAVHAIDGGAARTKLDRLQFSGVHTDKHRVAVCDLLIRQFKAEEAGRERWTTDKIPSVDFEQFYVRFLDSIEFVLSFKRPERCPAPLTACVASAWYTEDRERLGEFLTIMHTGEVTGARDRAAIRLLLHITKGKYGAGSPARNDLFLRCCGALRYFIAGEPLSKLYVTPDHAFPLVEAITARGEAS
jgi:hypothetical protein